MRKKKNNKKIMVGEKYPTMGTAWFSDCSYISDCHQRITAQALHWDKLPKKIHELVVLKVPTDTWMDCTVPTKYLSPL